MPKSGRTREAVARAERALIVKSSHDAIIGMTRDGVITSCNPAASRLYGHPCAELVGRSAELLIPPDHRAQEAEIFRRIAAGEEVEPYRAMRVRQDGTQVLVSLTISPIIDSTGAVIGAATASRAVGGLQEARDRFETRVTQQRAEAHDAADRFEARVEQQRAEAHDAADRFEAGVGRERAQAQDAQDAQDRSQAMVDAEMAHTVEERDQLQAQLQQSQRLEVLGQLAGGIAHDFNNLLAVILNYAAFVSEELATGARADWAAAGRDVNHIRRAAERAAGLTHQLLAFARREVIQPQVLDLNETVTEVRHLLDRTIGGDVVLETELARDLWPVLADAGQIEQVLVNLSVNARDAMTGGGMLRIDTANMHHPGGPGGPGGRHVRVRVRDTGTGMPAEVIEHAFEPFYTTKPPGAGTGLGLATVYGIVAQAGATVAIESTLGTGTTFTILFPVTEELPAPAPASTPYLRTPSGETVLVVEDEQALREVTERIFTNGGYRVVSAAGGAEALTLAAHHDGDIDLLVTDVVMPSMLGKEVAARLRELKPGIKVLYMSGYAQPVLASQGRLDRNVHLIEKPFSAKDIVEKAGRVLNERTPWPESAGGPRAFVR